MKKTKGKPIRGGSATKTIKNGDREPFFRVGDNYYADLLYNFRRPLDIEITRLMQIPDLLT